MLLESAFHELFRLKFYTNWLPFLRVMQENKSGCFFEHGVGIKHGHLHLLTCKCDMMRVRTSQICHEVKT